MRQREKELQKILDNKVHGSSELYNLLIQHFQKYSDDLDYIATASKRIKNNLAHFPVIINLINDIEVALKCNNIKYLKSYLQSLKIKKNKTYFNIFRKAENSISEINTVITISHSKTLIEIFRLWKKLNPILKVFVCESRPNNEGILMAEELLKLKIKTEIITEAMAGSKIKTADAVILGADQILSNGNIINKTGSRILAIIARYEGIPVYVFSTSDKKVRRRIKTKDAAEKNKFPVLNHKRLKYINENFEEIEKKLVTRIFYD